MSRDNVVAWATNGVTGWQRQCFLCLTIQVMLFFSLTMYMVPSETKKTKNIQKEGNRRVEGHIKVSGQITQRRLVARDYTEADTARERLQEPSACRKQEYDDGVFVLSCARERSDVALPTPPQYIVMKGQHSLLRTKRNTFGPYLTFSRRSSASSALKPH